MRRFIRARDLMVGALALGAASCSGVFAQEPARSASPAIDRTAQPERREVDWEAVRAQVARERQTKVATLRQVPTELGLKDREKADRARLPVLLPQMPALMGTLKAASEEGRMSLAVRPDFYASSVRIPGATLEILGTRTARVLPPGQTPQGVRPPKTTIEDLRIQQGDFGPEVSFERYGCAYRISVICDDPDDTLCRDEERIAAFARSMSFVGGQPDEEAR